MHCPLSRLLAFLLTCLLLPQAALARQTTLLCYGDFKSGDASLPATLRVDIAGEMAQLSEGPLADPRDASVMTSQSQYRVTAPDTVLLIDRETSHFSYLDRSGVQALGGRGKCRVDATEVSIPLRAGQAD